MAENGDEDKRLAEWAAQAPHKFAAFAEWLRNDSTPDQRHAWAEMWNWDFGLAPLLWIVRQPDCDKATALVVFFQGDPFYYLKFAGDRSAVPDYSVATYDLLVEIRGRLESGFYTRSEIAFDGAVRMASVHRSKAEPSLIAQFYPKEAEHDIAGRNLSPETGVEVEMPYFDIA